MAQTAAPIKLQHLVQLTSLGIHPDSVRFSSLTLESDKFVCVRENVNNERALVIVDLESTGQPARHMMKADSAIMHPKTKVIGLKAGKTIQIFNLEMKTKMKSHHTEEEVLFWRWISLDTIALVTETAVFHWKMEGEAGPVKAFDRDSRLAACQIISYKTSADEKWMMLLGIQRVESRVEGLIQLYSMDRKGSQVVNGHAGAFASFKVPGAANPSTLFAFASRGETKSLLNIVEVGAARAADGTQQAAYPKKQADILFSAETGADFPVAMHISDKFGLIFIVTKFGNVFLYDIGTGLPIYTNRITTDLVVVTTDHTATNGVMGVSRSGQIFTVSVDESTIVQYICQVLRNYDLAYELAARSGLSGADDLFVDRFEGAFQQRRYRDAAAIACKSPQGMLRTAQTLQRFKQAPAIEGQPAPLLQYFAVLMEEGNLSTMETLELAQPVVQQGKLDLLRKWIKEEKIECSEELGNMVRPVDDKLSLAIYVKAKAYDKVIARFAEMGEFDRIVPYAQKVGYSPDYLQILSVICQTNPTAARDFAIKLARNEGGSLVDNNRLVDLFANLNMIKELTAFVLEVISEDKESNPELQTRLLEINLMTNPQIANAILEKGLVKNFDRNYIASMCEKTRLYQRALEFYEEIDDIKRVIVHANVMDSAFVVAYFEKLSAEDGLEVLRQLLTANLRQNMQIVVSIAAKHSEKLETNAVIELFESFNSFETLFYYLANIVSYSQDPDVHFKYIEAAARIGHHKEVERICRESDYYDAARVRDFLKEAKLSDPLPLIIVCDRYDFVAEMTEYLYKNNMLRAIEVYVQKLNPSKAHVVIGQLLDLDCDEDFIRSQSMAVRQTCDTEALVQEVEKRNRLKLLLPMLEARLQDNATDTVTHTAVGKIYVDMNQNAEEFLLTNEYYDSQLVGLYCEKRDPHLAVVAYKRGQCDMELVNVTNNNSLFKHQARYLMERQSEELWEHVMSEENEFRRSVVDQVINTAIPESESFDQVSATVRAFMNLPEELIELLEKIVLHDSKFNHIKNLQDLLLVTAMKADTARVMDYAHKLDNYDGEEIAALAVDNGLYEEAFAIYQKFEHHVDAIAVLLENVQSMERALSYAERVDKPEVWSKLANSQLKQGLVGEALSSFVRADDPSHYLEVIAAVENSEKFTEIVPYLNMARKKVKEQAIDSALVFAYAKTDMLPELEEFVSGPSVGQMQTVGDRCYEEGLFEAARILYKSINNYARLSATLIRLGEFQAAVDAARDAKSIRTWKDVCIACVDQKEFRLAQMCGMHIIVQADELDDLIEHYERRGYFEELIQMMEAGLPLQDAHMGLFTELGNLYAKYSPKKLMEHLKLFYSRINIPKLIRAAESSHLWAELCFLYVHYDEYDNSAMVMIEHPIEAWDHGHFEEILKKVKNHEIYYKAITFYLAEHPLSLVDLLGCVSDNLDHARVVAHVDKAGQLPLIKQYLAVNQKRNLTAINDALNRLCVEEEDYEGLRQSIDNFDSYDAISLAQSLAAHELLEFRRIAAYLYKKEKRYKQSVDISKGDDLYKDAIETALESGDAKIAEALLRFFVDKGDKECFAATLYTCYKLIAPDVALELAWRNKMTDFAMPFFVQVLHDNNKRMSALEAANEKRDEEIAALRKELSGGGAIGEETGAAPADYFMQGQQPGVQPSQYMPEQAGYIVPYGDPSQQQQNMQPRMDMGGFPTM